MPSIASQSKPHIDIASTKLPIKIGSGQGNQKGVSGNRRPTGTLYFPLEIQMQTVIVSRVIECQVPLCV